MGKLKRRVRKQQRAGVRKPKKPESVKGKDANALFDKVAEEVLHGDREILDNLTQHERTTVIDWFVESMADEDGQSPIHDVLWEIDYHRKPVDIEQFINDDYYLGKACSELHPLWKRDLCAVFAPGSPVFEWILTGAIGVGKGQPVHGKVLTPEGWGCIGDLKVGDKVIG